MKIHLRLTIGSGSLILACFLILLGIHPAHGLNSDGVQKILVLPPKLHAAQEMDFLRKGVVDMLVGRLTHPDRITVLTLDASQTSVPEDAAAAVSLARELGVDYVVLESVVILGDSVSTDAQVLASATGQAALTFSRTGKSQAEIIAHVEQLAARINGLLLGTAVDLSTDKAAVATRGGTPPAKRSDIHQHPEKLLTGLDSSQAESGRPDGYGHGDSTTAAAMKLLLRGRRMDMQIRGVTAGDVDGDGALEIVCIDARTILAFRIQQGRLVKMAQVEAGASNVGVDAADLNGNGIDELFITHFDNKDGKLLSFVLEWDGKEFKRLTNNLRWYFRSVEMAERGRILIGQRQGVKDLFVPGIYQMEYTGGTYEGTQRLNLPRDHNLFGFAQGALRSAGMPDLVAYSRNGYLRVMDSRGREEWTSTESYGGTTNALIVKSKDDPNEQDILFLPSRVHLVDLDNDGLKEIVTVRNEDTARVLPRVKLFKQGRLEILKWDQLGLRPVLSTPGIAKFIADFTLADVYGDGQPVIVAAIVQKTRKVTGAGSSYLAVFSIGKP